MRLITFLILLLAISPHFTGAQNGREIIISGTVSDKTTGVGLNGVSVYAPALNKTIITDNNGHYSINVLAQNSALEFSYTGFLSQTIKIKDQRQINIDLVRDVQNLGEVVVVGYGSQKKSDLTGAVSVVDMKEMNKRSVATLDQALQGQVAGVDVTTNSGTPGGGVMVRIRGIGTLNDANPLYVVDGMMLNGVDFLNPTDVESVQVLKDASATAIYGSRGANGVVIITTKKGRKGKSQISLNSYYGVQNPWRSSNVMDGPTWGYLKNEAMVAAGYEPAIQDPSKLQTTDWFKEITHRNAPISNLSLSASGASEKGDYYFSLDRFAQDGIIKKTDYDRITFRSNVSYNVKPWMKIGENITLVKSNSQVQYENDEYTSMMVTAFTRDPATPVKNPDGSFAKGIYNDIWNPAATIEYTNSKSTNYRTLGNIFAHFSLLKDLVFKSDYSFEYTFGEFNDYVPVYYVFAVQRNDVSKLGKYNNSNFISQWTNTLNYDKKFGEHSISALLGAESYNTVSKTHSLNVNNVPSDNPDIRFIDNALGKNEAVVGGSMQEVKQLSAFARVNYSFKDRYLLTANFRADGSSKFTKNHRWGYFPSFSAGWKISEEPFFKSIAFISSLKLRAGWGQIGNQGSVAPYQYATSAVPGANYVFGGLLSPGFSFPGTGNSEIQWEKSTTTNIGVDFGLLGGRFSGSAEYFIKNTTDMLLRVPVPGQTGIQNPPFQNAGSMKNSGIELSLLYRNTDHEIDYSFGVNFTKINNKVINLGANNGFIDGASFANSFYLTRTIVGQPIAQFYGYKTNGLFQNYAEVAAQTTQQNVSPGDVKYVDADTNGVLDYYFLGSPLPKFTYSFNASIGYKGFDLSCALQGVYGNKIFNGPATYTRASSGSYNLSREMISRWRGEGTQNDARYPRLYANDANNGLFSDRFLEDGSYLRVKNVQLAYNLSQAFSKKLKLDLLRFYISAQNLFTITKYTGMDPEIGLRNGDPLDIGVDRGFYPSAKSYSVGINVTF
ncbi:MAG: TonB-dependent receptor [Ferruginibacter sp.]